MKNKRILLLASATTFLPFAAISCTKTKEVKKVEEENKNNKVMNPSDQQGDQGSKQGMQGKDSQKDQKPKQGTKGKTEQGGAGDTNQGGSTAKEGEQGKAQQGDPTVKVGDSDTAKQGESGNTQNGDSSANNADQGRAQQDDPMSDQETPKNHQNDQLTQIKEKYNSEYNEAESLFSDPEEDKEQIAELKSINNTIGENATVEKYEAAIKKIKELLRKNEIQEDLSDNEQELLEALKKEYNTLVELAENILDKDEDKEELQKLESIGDQISSTPKTYEYETAIQKIKELIGDNEDDGEDVAAESEAI